MSRASAFRPLIGITAYWRTVDFGHWRDFPVTLAPQGYVDGVAAAGGLPLLVPPVPEVADDPALALDRLDGLLFVGGEDLDPATYGAEPHPATGAANELRDRAELALLREALARELPVLGICRGAQLLNVAYGGDLVQDMTEVVDLDPHLPRPGEWGRHPVHVTGGKLRELAGGEFAEVRSHHHQAFGAACARHGGRFHVHRDGAGAGQYRSPRAVHDVIGAPDRPGGRRHARAVQTGEHAGRAGQRQPPTMVSDFSGHDHVTGPLGRA